MILYHVNLIWIKLGNNPLIFHVFSSISSTHQLLQHLGHCHKTSFKSEGIWAGILSRSKKTKWYLVRSITLYIWEPELEAIDNHKQQHVVKSKWRANRAGTICRPRWVEVVWEAELRWVLELEEELERERRAPNRREAESFSERGTKPVSYAQAHSQWLSMHCVFNSAKLCKQNLKKIMQTN